MRGAAQRLSGRPQVAAANIADNVRMHAASAALPALIVALAASPALLPLSQPPIVTALAELWALAVAGIIILGWSIRAWKEAPLQVAGFEQPDGRRSPWPGLLVASAALAGLASAFIGIMQVLVPDALSGPLSHWIEPSHLPGRAVGHLRQPNHLATVLLWGAVGWVVLHAQGHMGRWAAAAGMAVLMAALVLSGSRTGLLGLAFLLGWAVWERGMPAPARIVLACAPVWAAAFWMARRILSDTPGAAGGGDISSSRFAIWKNTWDLIEQQPWSGVGWGHFNIAWSLTPMTQRPPAFFDHAHNLPLHLMAELGAPLGLSAFGLMLAALIQGCRRAFAQNGPDGLPRRAAVVMLGIVGLHSLLEYPLWYAHLALPSFLALAVAMGWDAPWRRAARWQALLLGSLGATAIAASAWAWRDYQVVRAIYEPGPNAGSLSQRISRGQQLTWFADHAHYALATTVKPIPGKPWSQPLAKAFERAPHVLLDPRLMMAWADALASRDGPGDRDQARHLAARLREFNPAAARLWLEACEDPTAPPSSRFVCEPAEKAWPWRELMRAP